MEKMSFYCLEVLTDRRSMNKRFFAATTLPEVINELQKQTHGPRLTLYIVDTEWSHESQKISLHQYSQFTPGEATLQWDIEKLNSVIPPLKNQVETTSPLLLTIGKMNYILNFGWDDRQDPK